MAINWELQAVRFFKSAYKQGLFHDMDNKLFQTICANMLRQGNIVDSSQWFLHCNELHYRKGKSWFDYNSEPVVLSNSHVFRHFIANRDVVSSPPFKFSMYRTERNILYCGQKILARFINGVLLISENTKSTTSNLLINMLPNNVIVHIVADDRL